LFGVNQENYKIPEFRIANKPNENRIRYFRNLLDDKIALYIRDLKKIIMNHTTVLSG